MKLVATLLILKRLSLITDKDKSFPVLFAPKIKLGDTPIKPTKFAESFKKAVNFAAATDKKYPSLYSQLELGHNWEDVFKKVGFVC